jgi:hypothetical protein
MKLGRSSTQLQKILFEKHCSLLVGASSLFIFGKVRASSRILFPGTMARRSTDEHEQAREGGEPCGPMAGLCWLEPGHIGFVLLTGPTI